MRVADRSIQGRIALALSHLCSPHDQKSIFIDHRGKYIKSLLIAYFTIIILTYSMGTLKITGLDILLELLASTDLKLQRLASDALYKLCPMDIGTTFPISQVSQLFTG